jgi:hypothetical protein
MNLLNKKPYFINLLLSDFSFHFHKFRQKKVGRIFVRECAIFSHVHRQETT